MSLFGNTSSNIFNAGAAPITPQKSSLFGNISSNNTSIFGNSQAGGLFSNNNNNNGLGGGLFGNNNQQNQGGSLFSNTNSNTNNIFKSSNTTSLFQNNNSLFSNNANQANTPSLFNNNNQTSAFGNNNVKEFSVGTNFNGNNIQEKNGNSTYMNITCLNEFSYASQEELRLADYEKSQTGNVVKFKIINTSSNTGNLSSNNNFGATNGNIFGSSNTNNNNIFGTNSGTSNIFGNNNNQGGLFGNSTNNTNIFVNSNTNQGGLFGNNTSNQTSGLFGNNNTQGGGLFGNTTSNPTGGLFGNTNNTQSSSIFGNNNTQSGLFSNNKTTGGLFGNANSNQNTGGLFGNNNNQNTGGLFGNNNNQNSGGLFGNNNNQNTGGLFGNNTNQTSSGLFGNNNNQQTGGLFGNNNNQQTGGLFGNNNNQQTGGLFGNNNNQNSGGLFGNTTANNTNTGSGLFGNTSGGGLFGNNTQSTGQNKTNQNSLFGNTTSLFGNTSTTNTNSLFSNNNTSNNQQTGLFGETKSTSLFGNTNTQSGGLFGNSNTTSNGLFNNNINTNTPIDATGGYDLTIDDIIDPIKNLNTQKSFRLSPKDEILSKSIAEAVQKQRTYKEFLEDIDKKYKNDENNEENIDNDILESYGTYLSSSNKQINYGSYDNGKNYTNKRLNVRKYNDYDNPTLSTYTAVKFKNLYNETPSLRASNIDLSQSISKINETYDEYEKYKNAFNNRNNILKKSQMSIYNMDTEGNLKLKQSQSSLNFGKFRSQNFESFDKNYNIDLMGRNENLYRKNLMELNKLSEFNIKVENDENSDIQIMNDYNAADNKSSSSSNSRQTVDLVIKYSLPDEENNNNNNMNKLHLDNVNKYIKIKTLRDEIKSRIYGQLKLKNLGQTCSIERISLLIPGEFLDDKKTLHDYNLASSDFNIQAFITYNSNSATANKKKVGQTYKKVEKKTYKKEIVINDNELVPINLVPILTKDGYKCSPSIMELSRKTASELRKVENFKIYNRFGEVLFKEPVNLLGLNLDNQVTIDRDLIDTGDKLNYWSIFKLYNFRTEENGLNKHKINLKNSGGKFISYKNNELVWEYKVNNAAKI